MAIRQEGAPYPKTQVQPGKILATSTWDTPRYGLLVNENGTTESVRLLGLDDIEGHSPCYRFTGDDLVTRWESTPKFKVIDPSCLPASKEALHTMGQMLSGNNF